MSAFYTNDLDVKKIAKIAYPDYNGRKYKVEVENSPIDVCSYWEGGSRDFFVFLRLDTLATWEMPQQSAYDKKAYGGDNVQLVKGMICIEHSYCCGKDMGITIHISPEDAPKRIESESEKSELTREEKIVLVYTNSGLKNTYAGITNIRFHEATKAKGISLEQWNNASESLKTKKLLTKSGVITNGGRNAIGDLRDYQIK